MGWNYLSITKLQRLHRVWDEITYPFPNFNGCTVEVWKWISNFIPHFIMDVTTFYTIKVLEYWWQMHFLCPPNLYIHTYRSMHLTERDGQKKFFVTTVNVYQRFMANIVFLVQWLVTTYLSDFLFLGNHEAKLPPFYAHEQWVVTIWWVWENPIYISQRRFSSKYNDLNVVSICQHFVCGWSSSAKHRPQSR